MAVNKSISFKKNSTIPGEPEKNNDTFSLFNNPVVLGVLAFLILTVLFSLLIYQRFELVKETKNKEAYEVVNLAKDKIQEALTHSLSATKTLSFFINNNGVVNNFDSIAKHILESGKDIDALQLVPGGVIEYVYPLKGNENVIGYNILKDPARNKEAYKAIEKKQMFFAGPFELRQGGMGVVGRLPVYRNDKFWGFSAVVIKLSTLFKTADIDSAGTNGYYFQLFKINADTKEKEYFLPLRKDLSKRQSVSVQVPDGEWNLSVMRINEYNAFNDIVLLAILGLMLSFIGGISVYHFAIRPKKLNDLVKARTSELRSSENNYRSLIERVSDAFVSIDKEWNYTYVNGKAGELFGQEPNSLIGKNIWTEFPEGINQPFYHAYYRAMETQSYQYLEEFYPPYDKWFENHIYPSEDGLTIFFKDISEIKKVAFALKTSEEKYRSLIEQASDGIVITDLDGEILEINNSVLHMLGYSDEELMGHQLTEFLPIDEKSKIPLRINELLQGKSLLYERRLLKKDGTLLEVEINSKMASSHTLIGFIRDITQRKKAEADIKKSTERFELIAEATNDVIWDHDFTNNITWGNKNLYKLYGFEDESTVINFDLFLNHIHPEERENIQNKMNLAIKNHSSSYAEEFRFRMPDGNYSSFYDRAYIKYDDAGNPLRILGAMLDITEKEKTAEILKRSEQKYKLLFYDNPLPMWMTTIPGLDIIDVNESAIKNYGYSREEFLKLNAKDLRPPEDVDHFLSEVEKMTPDINNTRSWRHKKKDGSIIHVDIYSHEILYEGKKVWLGLSQDVTEKYKAKQLLQKSYEEIRQLASNLQKIREEERTNIAREIHDELGQQLTGLKMDMHWLMRKINSTDDAVTNKMKESIELINATITSVRKISTDLRPSILDDLGLLAALEWQGEEFEKRSGIKIEFNNQAGDITVHPEAATAIFRIYQELLTNIARHANANLVKVMLQKDVKNLYFSLNDNGDGFDPDTIKNKKTLGLLGIKERTLLLGGDCVIKSKQGDGSSTSISIPIKFVKETN